MFYTMCSISCSRIYIMVRLSCSHSLSFSFSHSQFYFYFFFLWCLVLPLWSPCNLYLLWQFSRIDQTTAKYSSFGHIMITRPPLCIHPLPSNWRPPPSCWSPFYVFFLFFLLLISCMCIYLFSCNIQEDSYSRTVPSSYFLLSSLA